MEKSIRLILRYRVWMALSFVALSLFFAMQLPHIVVRNSVRDILSGSEKTYDQYEGFLRDFGGNATVVLEFDPAQDLESLREQVDRVVGRIDSTVAYNDLVILVERNRQLTALSQAQTDRLASPGDEIESLQVTITPQNSNHFETVGEKISIESATVESEADYLKDMVDEIDSIVKEEAQDGKIALFGSAVFNEILKSTMTAEMLKLFGVAFVIVSVFSFLFLSSAMGSLVSMISLLFGLMWAFAFLGLLEIPVSGALQLFPFFVLVVGTCYIIHFLTIFYKNWSSGVDKQEAIVAAYRTCSWAILGATITTFLGLISFCLIKVKVVAELGLISAIGTICMGLIALVFLPVFLSWLPLRVPGSSGISRVLQRCKARITLFVQALSSWSIAHYKLTLIVSLAIVLGSVSQFRHLAFIYNPDDWLPQSLEISEVAIEKIAAGKWHYVVELVLDAEETKDGILSPKFQESVSTLLAKLERDQDDLEIVHIASVERTIPEGRTLAKGMVGLDDLRGTSSFQAFVAEDLSKTKIELALPWGDHGSILRRVESIEEAVSESFPFPFHVTGKPIILAQMAKNLIESLNYGYLFAFVTVFLVMFVLLRRWVLNVLCLFPNLVPIVIILGALGFFGVPLDVLLLLTSTIILSISVDDTLHLFLHLKEDLRAKPNATPEEIFRSSQGEVGFGIVATSCLISLSFGVFAFSAFPIMQTVGLVIALGAMLALIADVVLVPALYRLFISMKRH